MISEDLSQWPKSLVKKPEIFDQDQQVREEGTGMGGKGVRDGGGGVRDCEQLLKTGPRANDIKNI